MPVLANRARMTTATTGTGTVTLGSAVAGYQTFADAGVTNGQAVRYVIEDGDAWEIGTGTYTASGTTLSRTVLESSNADAAISLTGNAEVFITAVSEDIQQPPSEGAFVDGDKTKLDGIETGADVTDTANVTAAGALMDSEVTNLAAVKAFDPADYATAAQGSLATTAHGWGDHALAGYLTSVAWVDVTGKPTFATVATTGAYSDLTGLPSLFDGAYSSLTGIPATFTPSAHTHAAGDVTSGAFADARIAQNSVTQHQAALSITESQISDLGTYEPADADILKADTADQLTAAFTAAVDDDGTQSSGTYTPSLAAGSQYKKIVNGGAFTLAPPSLASNEATTLSLFITNNASAGAITTSGFTQVTGDDFSTTNGDDFLCRIEVFDIAGTEYSLLNVVALQ